MTALHDAGHRVTVVDAGHPGAHRLPLPDTVAGAPLVRLDLRDRPAVAGVLAGVDVVVHLAVMVGTRRGPGRPARVRRL
nr:NAD-dependent epimerase/dehydratase family protein [Micromonospora sp. ATCC 39149]